VYVGLSSGSRRLPSVRGVRAQVTEVYIEGNVAIHS
jgi:hypothetical protein